MDNNYYQLYRKNLQTITQTIHSNFTYFFETNEHKTRRRTKLHQLRKKPFILLHFSFQPRRCKHHVESKVFNPTQQHDTSYEFISIEVPNHNHCIDVHDSLNYQHASWPCYCWLSSCAWFRWPSSWKHLVVACGIEPGVHDHSNQRSGCCSGSRWW